MWPLIEIKHNSGLTSNVGGGISIGHSHQILLSCLSMKSETHFSKNIYLIKSVFFLGAAFPKLNKSKSPKLISEDCHFVTWHLGLKWVQVSQEIVTSECSSISSVHSKDDDFEKVCDSIRNNMADEVVIQLNFIKTAKKKCTFYCLVFSIVSS